MKDVKGVLMDETVDDGGIPTLQLDNPPEGLADKEAGHVCRLEIVGKVAANDGGAITLDVQKVKYLAAAGKMGKDEYLSKTPQEREEYDREQVDLSEGE
jgi:hypothetical protein